MSDIQRWTNTDNTVMQQHAEGRYILYADHVEALRQAEQRGREFILSIWKQDGYDEEKRMAHMYEQGQRDARSEAAALLAQLDADIQEAQAEAYAQGQRDALAHHVCATLEQFECTDYEQGQRDMLARCIAAVEALVDPWPTSAPGALPREMVLAALRALGGSDE